MLLLPGLGQPLLLQPHQLVRDDHQGGAAAGDVGVGQHQGGGHAHLVGPAGSPPGMMTVRDRVVHSHWSRSVQILCSHWWNFYYAAAKVFAITTHLKADKMSCYGMISGFHAQKGSIIGTRRPYAPSRGLWELSLYGVSNMIISDLEWTTLITVREFREGTVLVG